MQAKTSQLQIRVSPTEKATLKRLASASGLSVSAYVLSRVLPAAGEALNRKIGALERAEELDGALAELVGYLAELDEGEFGQATEQVELTGLTPLQRNYAAAAVEREASRRDRPPPAWTADVEPLHRPHFPLGLRALRPHFMRVSAPAFKRRNVFHPIPSDPRR